MGLNRLLEVVREQQLTFGFAESCTGGLLSASVVALPGVSDVFVGSIIAYSYPAKVDLLGVSAVTLQQEGAVSEAVARQMVRGVKQRLQVDCAVSVTGVAGPGGGTETKPVGTVWFAAIGPGFEVSQKMLFEGDRQGIQQQSADFAVSYLLQQLTR